jgi:hypothetical protein
MGQVGAGLVTKRDGRWFFHPYEHGLMPNHPTCYTGLALYQDRSRWSMQVRRKRPDGRYELIHTTPSRWRLVAFLRALTEARP